MRSNRLDPNDEATLRRLYPKMTDEVLRDTRMTDQIFEFKDEHGVTTCWNTSRIERAIGRREYEPELRRMRLDRALVDLVLRDRGVEEPHLITLTTKRLLRPILLCVDMEPDINEPGKLCERHIIIDGNHRIVGRWRSGLDTVDAWMCHRADLVRFEVELAPQLSILGSS